MLADPIAVRRCLLLHVLPLLASVVYPLAVRGCLFGPRAYHHPLVTPHTIDVQSVAVEERVFNPSDPVISCHRSINTSIVHSHGGVIYIRNSRVDPTRGCCHLATVPARADPSIDPLSTMTCLLAAAPAGAILNAPSCRPKVFSSFCAHRRFGHLGRGFGHHVAPPNASGSLRGFGSRGSLSQRLRRKKWRSDETPNLRSGCDRSDVIMSLRYETWRKPRDGCTPGRGYSAREPSSATHDHSQDGKTTRESSNKDQHSSIRCIVAYYGGDTTSAGPQRAGFFPQTHCRDRGRGQTECVRPP